MPQAINLTSFSEQALVQELSQLIEQSRRKVVAQANSGLVMLFWQVGRCINQKVLQHKRAAYSKAIAPTVPIQLKCSMPAI